MSVITVRIRCAALGCALIPLIAGCPASSRASGTLPVLPQTQVDTTLVAPTGRTLHVSSGGDFQAALNQAQPGDVIQLQAGAVFTGPFTLPAKAGDGWIRVESSAVASLPPPGTRVTPADSVFMPKLVASSGAVIETAPQAHGYRFIGIEIAPSSTLSDASTAVWRRWAAHAWRWFADPNEANGVFLDNLVKLGEDDTSVSSLPNHIIFDRCYLHGDPKVGGRRGIAMNSAYTAVIDSYLSDFKAQGLDSQAIASWNGTGPFLIRDDYLEAAGENVMFGGADPSIPGLVPSDIEILGNDFSKPLAWEAGSPDYQGTAWTVKNLLELKNARRVLIEGNVLEYNWAQGQNGFGVLFTVRNQDGHAPWSAVQDVTFTDNVLRYSANGVNILGHDDNYPSQQTQRILIRNNLFSDIGYDNGSGTLFQLLDGTADVNITHNTADQSGSIVVSGAGRPHTGFVFSDNIVLQNQYGMIGTNTGSGQPTLQTYFPGAVLSGNLLIGATPGLYPPGNAYPASLTAVGFVNLAADQFELSATSPYNKASGDGSPPGVNFPALCQTLRDYGALRSATVSSCDAVSPFTPATTAVTHGRSSSSGTAEKPFQTSAYANYRSPLVN